jgi:hypothetical protein
MPDSWQVPGPGTAALLAAAAAGWAASQVNENDLGGYWVRIFLIALAGGLVASGLWIERLHIGIRKGEQALEEKRIANEKLRIEQAVSVKFEYDGLKFEQQRPKGP